MVKIDIGVNISLSGENLRIMASERPESYLLLHNVGKRQNWGQLLRSATAFNVAEVGVVGAKRIQELSLFGNQGTSQHAQFRWFESLDAACAHYRAQGARICGIEISDSALAIGEDECFSGPTVFMLGNEGTGMNEKQIAACDYFVYIPQYSEATASLNVAVAGSIVLHHFALWAKFRTAPIDGRKFVTSTPKSKLDQFLHPSEEQADIIAAKREERKRRRE